MTVRLAAQEAMLEGATLEEKYAFARSVGFHGIELSGRGNGEFMARAAEFRAAKANGVRMPSAVVAMPHFVGAFDPDHRRRAVQDVKDILATLPEAGAAGVVMPNSYGVFSLRLPPFEPPRPQQESRAALIDALGELGAYAADHGVEVFLEPLNRYEDYLINTLDDAVSVVAEVGSPGVSVIADTFHMSIEEARIGESIRRAGSAIHHVQLGDSDRLEPGHGHYDWPETLQALQEINYDGWLAMECRLSGEPKDVLAPVAQLLNP